jgi:hypothetical protein
MNEAETRLEHIDPAPQSAGWGVVEITEIRKKCIFHGRREHLLFNQGDRSVVSITKQSFDLSPHQCT